MTACSDAIAQRTSERRRGESPVRSDRQSRAALPDIHGNFGVRSTTPSRILSRWRSNRGGYRRRATELLHGRDASCRGFVSPHVPTRQALKHVRLIERALKRQPPYVRLTALTVGTNRNRGPDARLVHGSRWEAGTVGGRSSSVLSGVVQTDDLIGRRDNASTPSNNSGDARAWVA
jgi:hypothetical protein